MEVVLPRAGSDAIEILRMIPFLRVDTLLIGVSRYDVIREHRVSYIIIRVFHFYVYLLHMHVPSRTSAGEDVSNARKLYMEEYVFAVASRSVNDILRVDQHEQTIIHVRFSILLGSSSFIN